jgi:hypothetical protein
MIVGDSPLIESHRIRLALPVTSEEGVALAGSSGTIVHVWSSGNRCELEFTNPFHTVARDDIEAA